VVRAVWAGKGYPLDAALLGKVGRVPKVVREGSVSRSSMEQEYPLDAALLAKVGAAGGRWLGRVVFV